MAGRRVRAYIGLGANIGDAAATLARAVAALDGLPGVSVRGVSRLYVTTPVGVTDQPDFHNAVVALDVPGGDDPEAAAMDLLVRLKAIERDFGRETRGRWGPREIDLDLLLFGRARIHVERAPAARSVDADTDPSRASRLLEVPHREARVRLFVLAPLSDLVPWLSPPGWGETVDTARRRREAIEGPAAVRPVGVWDTDGAVWRAADATLRP